MFTNSENMLLSGDFVAVSLIVGNHGVTSLRETAMRNEVIIDSVSNNVNIMGRYCGQFEIILNPSLRMQCIQLTSGTTGITQITKHNYKYLAMFATCARDHLIVLFYNKDLFRSTKRRQFCYRFRKNCIIVHIRPFAKNAMKLF